MATVATITIISRFFEQSFAHAREMPFPRVCVWLFGRGATKPKSSFRQKGTHSADAFPRDRVQSH
jgi:hypothetical protein